MPAYGSFSFSNLKKTVFIRNGIKTVFIRMELQNMHVKELLFCLGSPFQYTVGQLQTGGSYKVQVGGPGLERGEVNMESRLKL